MNRPMWCDNFDMDLPTVIPGALGALSDLADVELFTHGASASIGALNHPTVWNGDKTMLAFFGFRNPSKPEFYYAGDPIVRCTVWEAFRDAWPNSYCMIVEGEPVWDTFALRGDFQHLLYHVRGIRYSDNPKRAERRVLSTIERAAQRLRALTERYAASVTRLKVGA